MKNEKIQLKIFFPILALGACLFLFPKNVFADGTSLKVFPSVFRIESKPPADVWAPFSVENSGDKPINLTVGYKAFDPLASENGHVVFFKNGQPLPLVDKKIFDKIQVVDAGNNSQNSISLGPKQSQKLRLHIIVPENEPSSDYYFSLIFLENSHTTTQNISNKNKLSQVSISTIQAGIALNVLLAIGDKEIPQGNIESFTTNWFQESGPVPFSLTVFNQGEHFIAPHGYILIKNMFGQTVGKIQIPNNVILAGTGRTLAGKQSEMVANALTKSNQNNTMASLPTLVWPEKFLLGMYTATLSLSLSSDGPTYARSIHFFAFPLGFLLAILLIFTLVFLIYLRVKKKIS